jgi:hypothetical protein
MALTSSGAKCFSQARLYLHMWKVACPATPQTNLRVGKAWQYVQMDVSAKLFVGAIFGRGIASEARHTRCRRDFLYLADCAETHYRRPLATLRTQGPWLSWVGLANVESCSRFRALPRAQQPLSGEIELVGCGVRAFVYVGRFHGRCFCQRFGDRRQYSTSATSQKSSSAD